MIVIKLFLDIFIFASFSNAFFTASFSPFVWSTNKNFQMSKSPPQDLPTFVEKYGKTYSSYNQLIYRDTVFKKNKKNIDENNYLQNASFTMGITRFADLTSQQFEQKILTAKFQIQKVKSSQKVQSYLAPPKASKNYLKNQETIGMSFFGQPNNSTTRSKNSNNISKKSQVVVNWKQKGMVGVVKQQGLCGSCYAFSALSSIESMYLINKKSSMGKSGNNLGKNNKQTFSQQHIIDCCDISKKCDMGCSGGYVWSVFDFIKNNGLYLQENYAYRASDENYIRKCDGKKGLFKNFLNNQKPYLNITKGNVQQLRQALTKGPVSVLIDATNWAFYVVNSSTTPKPFNNCSDRIHNHAVLLVGVDSSGNWLIKNSWGQEWGQKGYITLAAGNTCGIANYATYPNPYVEYKQQKQEIKQKKNQSQPTKNKTSEQLRNQQIRKQQQQSQKKKQQQENKRHQEIRKQQDQQVRRKNQEAQNKR